MMNGISAMMVATAVLAAPAIGHAGSKYEGAYCEVNPDGSGWCDGTLRGFRNSAYGTNYASFSSGTSPWNRGQFSASYQTLHGLYCFPTDEVYKLWPTAVAFSGGFTIYWNKSHECNALLLMNGSEHRDF